ncbi:MAG: hypothetical protein C4563_06435 [Desulfobulbus sp.]|jgi:hypothetical protein|nr:MAG: hypothetical protein C4563_06435 [Desulfobulbus sp.]
MPRILGTATNSLHIHDNISDSDIVLYYRNPTTSERTGYANMAVQRKRNKVTLHQAEARMKYGMLILTGFREGDFVRDAGGRPEVFASDPASPRYRADWKEEIEKGAADLVMLLAAHVFDVSAEIDEPDDIDQGEGGEEAPGNSGETSPQ